MKGKSGIETNSLEMLLDTMCNTFGGICFIAFLVCIILAMLPKGSNESDEEQSVVEMERMLVDKEVERLVRQRDDLKARIALKKSFIASNLNVIANIEIPNNLQSNKLALARLKRERTELEDELAKITTQGEYSKREAARLERLLQELQAKLNEPFKFPKRTVRTPMEREIDNLTSVDVFLYKRRFYLLSDTSQASCKIGVAENGKRTWKYTLLTERGIAINEHFCDDNKTYKKILSRMTDSTYMRIYCDSGSFHELCQIRDDLVKNQKMFNWHVQTTPTPVIEFIEGYDGKVQ